MSNSEFIITEILTFSGIELIKVMHLILENSLNIFPSNFSYNIVKMFIYNMGGGNFNPFY